MTMVKGQGGGVKDNEVGKKAFCPWEKKIKNKNKPKLLCWGKPFFFFFFQLVISKIKLRSQSECL